MKPLHTREELHGPNTGPLTQSLFLELGYHTQFALFTLKDRDYEYKGRTYPSLKRLYLEMGDVTEYKFATTYFLNWKHWKRISQNSAIAPVVEELREELEFKLRSEAILDVIGDSERSFTATKWIADKGWGKRPAGRPKKAETEREANMVGRLDQEFNDDIARMKLN